MSHVVLLGDSIFDNASYVPGGPPVIEQLRRALPDGWRATLLAVDGHVVSDVGGQLASLPEDASHLVISAGGNDALGKSFVLREPVRSVGEAMLLFGEIQAEFRRAYRQMLRQVLGRGRPTAVCTVYDAIPDLSDVERTALSVFNDVILREAAAAGLPVLDLRLVCDRSADYSTVSSIEPSVAGGQRIVAALVGLVTGHDFSTGRSVVFTR